MSVLLGHIKSHRAIAKALGDRAATSGQTESSILNGLSIAHYAAADDLERQAKDESTGEVQPHATPRKRT